MKAAFEAQETRTLRRLKAASTRKGTKFWDYGDAFDPAKEKKALDPAKVFPADQERDAFEEAVGPIIQNIYATFGKDVAESLGVAFNLRDPAVAADILGRTNRLRGVVDTTWNRVQEAIIDGEAEGETIDGIAKRIGRVFTQGKGYRARVIARTETVGAMNAGSLQAAAQSGVVEKKVWLAARDHRTRSTHVEADGQAVDVKAKFAVGGSRMDHPGDPAGGASEVVNCRCTLLFQRTKAPDVEVPVDDVEIPPTPVDRSERMKALRQEAESMRTRTMRTYPQGGVPDVKAAKVAANVQREADIRALGAKIRQEALERAGVVEADPAKLNDLRAKVMAIRDERWNLRLADFGEGIDPHTGQPFVHQVAEGKSRIDAMKKVRAKLERDLKAAKEELNRLESAPREARGRAALEVLGELRDMGIDPKTIQFETGSTTAAKDAVKEMSEWYPADWWKQAQGSALNKLQAKHTDTGRGYYSGAYPEKSKGVYRHVNRLMTSLRSGDYRSTTVHELGHYMENTQDDVTNLELRFWRRRTEDGRAAGGMRTYRYGKADEVVNPDEFGDEYMGKSYLARHPSIVKRERGVYDPASLDELEANDMVKTTSWEVLTMGMEELVFNHFGSWDKDLDYIDFVLGVLGGV